MHRYRVVFLEYVFQIGIVPRRYSHCPNRTPIQLARSTISYCWMRPSYTTYLPSPTFLFTAQHSEKHKAHFNSLLHAWFLSSEALRSTPNTQLTLTASHSTHTTQHEQPAQRHHRACTASTCAASSPHANPSHGRDAPPAPRPPQRPCAQNFSLTFFA